MLSFFKRHIEVTLICILVICVGHLVYVGSLMEQRDDFVRLMDYRQSAAIEYTARKEFYQSLPADSEVKASARQDVLDAFKEWEGWAEKVRNHPHPTN